MGCSIVGHAVDQGTTNNRSLAARVLMVACTRRPRCLVLPPTFSACPFPADSCDAIEVPPGNPGAIVEARQDVGLRCGCRGLAVAPAQLSSWRPPAPTAPCEIIPLPKPRPKRWRAEPDAAAPPSTTSPPIHTSAGTAFSPRMAPSRPGALPSGVSASYFAHPYPPPNTGIASPMCPSLGLSALGVFLCRLALYSAARLPSDPHCILLLGLTFVGVGILHSRPRHLMVGGGSRDLLRSRLERTRWVVDGI